MITVTGMNAAAVMVIIGISEIKNSNNAIITGMTEMTAMTGEMGNLRRRDIDG